MQGREAINAKGGGSSVDLGQMRTYKRVCHGNGGGKGNRRRGEGLGQLKGWAGPSRADKEGWARGAWTGEAGREG